MILFTRSLLPTFPFFLSSSSSGGTPSLARSIKSYYKKKPVKYWPSGQENELDNYRMVCEKIYTDRKWIKTGTVHVINLDKNKRKESYHLTFSLPYFSGYIWPLLIPLWCSRPYFTSFWFIFLPFLPEFSSPHLKLRKKKKGGGGGRITVLGLAHNSARLGGVCLSALVSSSGKWTQ